jgi:hypothetical protein
MQNHSIPRSLITLWVVSFGSLALAFPIYSYLAFTLDVNRDQLADVFAIHAATAYWLGMGGALLPLPALKHWPLIQRIKYACLAFMLASYLTHLSWELVWLLLHESISQAKDAMWAYPWWAYIDGGDMRYFEPETDFLMIEILSVINGSIGLTGLYLLIKSNYRSLLAILLCMSTAVTHTVLTWYYYGTEILTGFASVNTASFNDLWVKFILLNGPWLVFPWLVLIFGYWLIQQLINTEQS